MRTKLFSIYARAVVLSLASCSQNEPAEQGTTLPDGMYPMTFTVVQAAPESTPQTRVTESGDGMSSQWTNDDRIKITVSGPGNNMEAEMLRINDVFISDRNLYWQNTNDATVNAWYSNIEGQSTMPPYDYYTVSLADQSGGLAYVLKAEPVKANYQTKNITLTFSHQLAKVRVKLVKGSYGGDLSDATVKIKGHTSCTVKNGEVSEGGGEGYITMHKNGEYYEANLVPGTLQASEAFEISTDSKTTKASLKGDVSLEKGKVHTITITVNAAGPEEIIGGEITEPGDYIMKGNITESITLNASGINLTLDNVQSKTDGAPLIIGNNAQVTLNISGTANSLTSTNGNGIEIRNGASLTITGNGMNSSKLVVNASDNTNPETELKAGIGPSTGNVSIKTINISNVHLVVSGGRTGNNGNGPAAIGLCSVNGTFNQSCEGISITDSKIEATSYGGACIGTGSVSNDMYTGGTYNLGPITITSSQIIATANRDSGWGHSGACIGFGYIGSDANGVIENITITKSTLDLTVGNSNAYKIGRGDIENNATYSITNGIIVDGQNKGNEGWNP